MLNRPYAYYKPVLRGLVLTTALAALTACDDTAGGGLGLDWDLRSGGGALDTSGAALQVSANRPSANSQGVLNYPNYQVAVARRGDTVASLATRVGIGAAELASFNALRPEDPLRDGETLVLPRRVQAGLGGGNTGAVIGGNGGVQPVDVAGIATTALDRVGGSTAPAPAAASGPEPQRHKVARGETAYSIARIYGVSAKSIADWNGLPADLAVREGQFLIIPVAAAGAAQAPVSEVVVAAPGEGSLTPVPPSASQPLPDEDVAPAAETPKATPASPDLGEQRTQASAARFVMPADGKIIRGYAKGKNEGIDIAAAAGSGVKAAADGVVAAITKDTEQVPIVVIRHAGGLLTVYAGLDGIKVAKGAQVKRGQTIASVRAGSPAFVHFEVRKGVESIDPIQYLQ